jgi:hypothetical protein
MEMLSSTMQEWRLFFWRVTNQTNQGCAKFAQQERETTAKNAGLTTTEPRHAWEIARSLQATAVMNRTSLT